MGRELPHPNQPEDCDCTWLGRIAFRRLFGSRCHRSRHRPCPASQRSDPGSCSGSCGTTWPPESGKHVGLRSKSWPPPRAAPFFGSLAVSSRDLPHPPYRGFCSNPIETSTAFRLLFGSNRRHGKRKYPSLYMAECRNQSAILSCSRSPGPLGIGAAEAACGADAVGGAR